LHPRAQIFIRNQTALQGEERRSRKDLFLLQHSCCAIRPFASASDLLRNLLIYLDRDANARFGDVLLAASGAFLFLRLESV